MKNFKALFIAMNVIMSGISMASTNFDVEQPTKKTPITQYHFSQNERLQKVEGNKNLVANPLSLFATKEEIAKRFPNLDVESLSDLKQSQKLQEFCKTQAKINVVPETVQTFNFPYDPVVVLMIKGMGIESEFSEEKLQQQDQENAPTTERKYFEVLLQNGFTPMNVRELGYAQRGISRNSGSPNSGGRDCVIQ